MPAAANCATYSVSECTFHERQIAISDGDNFALDTLQFVAAMEDLNPEETAMFNALTSSEKEIIAWMRQWYQHYLDTKHPVILSKEALRRFVEHDDENALQLAHQAIEGIQHTRLDERHLLQQLDLIRMWLLVADLKEDDDANARAVNAYQALFDEAVRRANTLSYHEGALIERLARSGDSINGFALRLREDGNAQNFVHSDQFERFQPEYDAANQFLDHFAAFRLWHAEQGNALAQWDVYYQQRIENSESDAINEWLLRAADNGSNLAIMTVLAGAVEVSEVRYCGYVESLGRRGYSDPVENEAWHDKYRAYAAACEA